MKKTLTLLLTALLTAAAANADLVASFDSLTGINQKSGNWGFYNNTSVNPVFNDDGTATFQGGADVLFLKHYDADGTNTNVNMHDYTLTMTISGLQAGGNTGNSLNALFTTSNTWGLCLDSNDNTKLTGVWDGVQWNDDNNRTFSFPTDAPFTLTAVMGGNKNGVNGTLVYINGEEVAFMQGLLAGIVNSKQYTIGNNSSGNQGTAFTLHNLYVHDSSLSAEEVAQFYASIPEPATASLSLMGLAALLMRRKRA